MAVYAGNSVRELESAVQSGTIEQTLSPAQVVIVRDGPVSLDVQRCLNALQSTVDAWYMADSRNIEAPEIVIVELDSNGGLARALNIGLRYCTHDYVARADCDDISLPDRFAITMPILTNDEEPVDVVGGAIQEFQGNTNKLGQIRTLPHDGKELAKYARLQSPMHHPSVVFRKATIERIGGYREDVGRFEDYYLWEQLLLHKAQLFNVPEVLVLYRTDDEAYERRGGWDMFREECHLQWRFLHDGFLSPWQFIRNITVRTFYRIIPASLRRKAYHAIVQHRNEQAQR